MNDRIFLTIGIPTYLREESLKQLLNQLANTQPICNCELLIINNGPVIDLGGLPQLLKNVGYAFRLIQNAYNCGGQENVLRIYENAGGDYIWFLGDDDRLYENTLNAIICYIKANPCDCFHFNAKAADHPDIQLRDGYYTFTEIFSGAIPLRKFMFAPLNVIRKESILQHLPRARLHLGCFTPQLSLMLLGELDKFYYLNRALIHCDNVPVNRNQRLSILPVFLGIGYLPHIVSRRDKRIMINRLLKAEWKKFTNPITVIGALAIAKITAKKINLFQYIKAGYRNYPILLALAFPFGLLFIKLTPANILSGLIKFSVNKLRKKAVDVNEYFSEDRL